ncbi:MULTISPECIES: ATP-binding protein [unclassified Fibrobacter]|uniref:ATP-binding protein n=1 Tax=unclassified Fibrobacter TaxID=2634177 RepID=UPI000D6B2A62|nr:MULTISPECIES: ATP-binding protein [unclassified Fibrobacter]PWJ71950.1 hypothetical protein BGX12_101189 [Fibrobacter sp. UWR4]PZW70400.1 hypothetical protein C8E88_101257 [Fibrobacter sp. UWR1]
MKRRIIENLKQWKHSDNRKPLILDGARQVGKTWILQEFGKSEFSSVAYFNCDRNTQLEEIFKKNFEKDIVLRNLEALAGKPVTGDTLIIFDEIQETPVVLTALKYFQEQLPELYIACAGSLLGLSLHSGTGFPVGKVDILKIFPMDFAEFVLAVKGDNFYDILTKDPLDKLETFHETFVELLRQYYFVGGMPEAVQAFANGKSIADIRTIQNAILYSYNKDISKHAETKDIQRIHQVWNSIPQQLAKENKKFVYGAIRTGARAKEFESAIQWLLDAGIVYKVNRIRKAGIPLKFYEDAEAFKLFFLDCGLMGAFSDTPPEDILIGSKIFEEYKGAFTELFVLQQFKATLEATPFYFSADDSKQELDFILQMNGKLVPIEVKAEENLRAKSLRQFVLEHEGIKGIRISMSKYREQDWMTNIPLYAAGRFSY